MLAARNFILPVLALVALSPSRAAAAPAVSCSAAVDGYLGDADIGWLNVVGTAVTARGGFGFSRFTMADGFQIETYPLHTAGAAARRTFFAGRNSSNAFSGYFHVVFPDRGNGDEDRTQLWVGSGGNFWLRSITWGGGWTLLQSPVCYSGPSGQLVVTGHIDNPGFGTDFWTFVMQPGALI